MTSDTRQRVKQPERINKFKKIIIDTYRDEYAIVAETEDLIVEYCVREKSNYKSVRQGRRSRKQLLQDAKATSERLAGQHIQNRRRRIIRRCQRIPRTIGTSEAPHCHTLNNKTVSGVDADDIRRF